MGPNRPQVNAKCGVVMKLSVFGTRTDHSHTHTHTHKAKPIHPRYAGCNNASCDVVCVIFMSQNYSSHSRLVAWSRDLASRTRKQNRLNKSKAAVNDAATAALNTKVAVNQYCSVSVEVSTVNLVTLKVSVKVRF